MDEPNSPEITEMPRKKTSLYLDEDLYKEFQIYVVTKYGYRRTTEIIEQAIKEFMKKHPIGKDD